MNEIEDEFLTSEIIEALRSKGKEVIRVNAPCFRDENKIPRNVYTILNKGENFIDYILDCTNGDTFYIYYAYLCETDEGVKQAVRMYWVESEVLTYKKVKFTKEDIKDIVSYGLSTLDLLSFIDSKEKEVIVSCDTIMYKEDNDICFRKIKQLKEVK